MSSLLVVPLLLSGLLVFISPTAASDSLGNQSAQQQCINENGVRSLLAPQQRHLSDAVELLRDTSRQVQRLANTSSGLQQGLGSVHADLEQVRAGQEQAQRNADNSSKALAAAMLASSLQLQRSVDTSLIIIAGLISRDITNNSRQLSAAFDRQSAVLDQVRQSVAAQNALTSGIAGLLCDLYQRHADSADASQGGETTAVEQVQSIEPDALEICRVSSLGRMLSQLPSDRQQAVQQLQENCVPLLVQQNVGQRHYAFHRSWAEFRGGFGDSAGNYWLGNELLHQLTKDGRYALRFDLQSDSTSRWFYAEYERFIVLAEPLNYTVLAGEYTGNATYNDFWWNNGAMFSTYDHNSDAAGGSANCAVVNGGGFWYNQLCPFSCNLNGVRQRNFEWHSLPGGKALKSSRMSLHCKEADQ